MELFLLWHYIREIKINNGDFVKVISRLFCFVVVSFISLLSLGLNLWKIIESEGEKCSVCAAQPLSVLSYFTRPCILGDKREKKKLVISLCIGVVVFLWYTTLYWYFKNLTQWCNQFLWHHHWNLARRYIFAWYLFIICLDYQQQTSIDLISWLVVWVLWYLNLCRLLKSIFIQIISSISNNSV